MRAGLYGRLRQIGFVQAAAPVAPGQVAGLAAGIADSSSVPLTWQADAIGTPPISYRIEYKRAADGTWSLDTTQTGTSRTVTGLQAGTAYQFRVRAENEAGAGVYSAVLSASTSVPVVAPSAPRNLAFAAGSLSVVNLTWDAPSVGSEPITYSVYYRHGTSGGYSLWGETTERAASLTGQPSSQTVSYYVTARNSAGTSGASNVVTRPAA